MSVSALLLLPNCRRAVSTLVSVSVLAILFGGRVSADTTPSITLEYQEPKDATQRKLQDALLPKRNFVGNVGFLKRYAWPRPLTIWVGECNATDYADATNTISICLSDAVRAYTYFRREGNSDANSIVFTDNTMDFFLLHETGHALIEQYGLPTTGSEEDAADEYAALIVAEQANAHAVGIQAAWYFAFSGIFRIGQLSPWDTHDDDRRRAAHIACIVDGAQPGQFADSLQRLGMSAGVEQQCVSIFHRQQQVWNIFLGPRLAAVAPSR